MKQKSKELDWYTKVTNKAKKFFAKYEKQSWWKYYQTISPTVNSFIALDKKAEEIIPNGEDIRDMKFAIAKEVERIVTQQRTELLDGQFEKSETEAEIASNAYDQGYLDCQKGRKKTPHDTREGYCCACDYDLACFEGKLKEVRTELLEEILGEIDKLSMPVGRRELEELIKKL